MTRISIEPAGLRRAASVLRDVATDHRRSASRLTAGGLPSMPPDLVARYAGRVRGLAEALDALAGDLLRTGSGLDTRARLADVAGQGGSIAQTVAPIPAPGVLSARVPRIPSVGMPQSGGSAARLMNVLGASPRVRPRIPRGAASRQDVACWLAGQSRAAGAPGELLVMAALTESGGRNLGYGDADSVGYFQIRPSTNFAPAGFGVPPGTKVSADWWVEHPDAQAAWAREKIAGTIGAGRDADLSDPAALGAWAQDIERSAYPDRYQQHYAEAHELVKHCHQARASASSAKGVLAVAARELGVREVGDNSGPRVSVYQERTGAYHAPWCASFVTWALEQSGHPMPAGNWAAVANYVGAAQAGAAGLEIVSAADARPGDLVAYDWGHGTDFGSDGHIGLLASDVSTGRRLPGDRGQLPGRGQRHGALAQRREHRLHPRSLVTILEVFELTVDYGAEELSALGRLLGAGDAPGLNAPDPAPMSPDTRRAVHAAAWRGLVARRALVIEPGPPPSFAVTEPHASLLAPLIAPERALTLDRWTPTAETRWTMYLRESAAVEQEALPGLLYRHTLVPREAAPSGCSGPRRSRSGRSVGRARGRDHPRRAERGARSIPAALRRSPSSTLRGRRSSGSTPAISASGAAAARAPARRPRRARRSGSNP